MTKKIPFEYDRNKTEKWFKLEDILKLTLHIRALCNTCYNKPYEEYKKKHGMDCDYPDGREDADIKKATMDAIDSDGEWIMLQCPICKNKTEIWVSGSTDY